MSGFRLTDEALKDLSSIADYTLANWGQDQASLYLDGLEARFDQLAEQPQLGRERSDLGEQVRSFPFESHIAFFVEEADGIAILRILHKRQDPVRHIG